MRPPLKSIAPALSVSSETRSNDSGEARKPKHREVFDSLYSDITSGRLRPGDRLPTEAELAETFSASRSTIARAMRDLKSRGLLQRHRGGGTRIAKMADSHRIALFAPFAQSGSTLGYIGGQIHTHLAELASRRGDDLRLQFMGRQGHSQLEQMLSAVDELVDKGVNGAIYYPVELPTETAYYNQQVVAKLKSAKLPVVLVDRDIVAFPNRSEFPLITYDNRRGGYLLTDHLIQRGRKRIVFIGIPHVSSAASDRMRGYFDALDDNGIRLDHTMIYRVTLDQITPEFCKTIIKKSKPDAIICKMDHYAAVVGRHLMAMGLKIGRDILLAGFDNQPIAEALPVPLTTIGFPIEPLSLVCYERLLKQMQQPAVADPGVTLIDVELIVRASTGK